jgi:hypothetical protein
MKILRFFLLACLDPDPNPDPKHCFKINPDPRSTVDVEACRRVVPLPLHI